MDRYISYKNMEKRVQKLNDHYEMDSDSFYKIADQVLEQDIPAADKLMHAFQKLLRKVNDEISQMENVMDVKPSCQMGCAFCCYFPIIVNRMEAKLIEQAIENMDEDRRNNLKNHLKEYFAKYEEELKQLTALDFETDEHFKRKYIARQVPCPMLDTNTNTCLAYEVRPIPCRTYLNYNNPKVCRDNLMPIETISYEFLYDDYMGTLNELLQVMFEEGDTAFVNYPEDAFAYDYLPVWLEQWVKGDQEIEGKEGKGE